MNTFLAGGFYFGLIINNYISAILIYLSIPLIIYDEFSCKELHYEEIGERISGSFNTGSNAVGMR